MRNHDFPKKITLRHCKACGCPINPAKAFCKCSAIQIGVAMGHAMSTMVSIIPSDLIFQQVNLFDDRVKEIYRNKIVIKVEHKGVVHKIKFAKEFHTHRVKPQCPICEKKITKSALFRRPSSRFAGDDRPLIPIFLSDDMTMFTIDHIIPQTHGGKSDKSNLQTMCALCNSWKSDMPMELAVQYFKELTSINDRSGYPNH